MMCNHTISILDWNVRGLGLPDKCSEIKRTISSISPTVVCLQESKLESISSFKSATFLPPRLQSFRFLPSVGASGGIVTAWSNDEFSLTSTKLGSLSLTTTFSFATDSLSFTVTNAYGPCDSQ